MITSNKSILIADHDEFTERILTEHGSKHGVRVTAVRNAMDALRQIHDHTPDVVCLAADLSGGDGWTIARLLRSDDRYAKLPVVLIVSGKNAGHELQSQQLELHIATGGGNLWETVMPLISTDQNRLNETKIRSLGKSGSKNRPASATAVSYETKSEEVTVGGPLASEALLDFVFSIMEQDDTSLVSVTGTEAEPRPWVLCVDDDRDYAVVLAHRLHARGVDVINAFDGAEGLSRARSLPADVILLDYDMPNGTGDYVLKELKQHAATKDIPVLVVTGNKNNDIRRLMLGLGADEFLQKPVPYGELFEVMSKYMSVPVVAR